MELHGTELLDDDLIRQYMPVLRPGTPRRFNQRGAGIHITGEMGAR
jgi:hypothetical protein